VHADSFIEEVGREDDDIVLILFEHLHFNGDISDVAKDVLSPSLSGVQAAFGMLEPE